MSIDIRSFDPDNDVINVITYIPSEHLGGRGQSIPCTFLNGQTTLFPKELRNHLDQALSKSGVGHLWIDSPTELALPCRVMRTGQAWQKGKIVISVNFSPDPIPELQPEDVTNELNIIRDQA